MRSFSPRWIVVAAALIAIGCANQKNSAEEVLAKIESAVAEIREQAARSAPNDLQYVETTLASLKNDLAKGDYKAVLADAPDLTAAVDSLKQTVAARKAEAEAAIAAGNAAATAEWNSLSADVTEMFEAIQSRVDILGKSKLPKNVSQEDFDVAKSWLESMKTIWAEATSEFASGDSQGALLKANAAKQIGASVLKKLGMSN